ncbi:MAG TPA: DDE-type integrase/transposase/recombinase [Actinomycetota bacterium]|nr:DDE-type integrase/transposase/recombinase [Actinomycetota bacterium]
MENRPERAEAIALFRYGVIAPAVSPHLGPAERGAIVRELAAGVHTDPEGVERVLSRATIDRWLRVYRDRGLAGLKPTPRSDTGALRRHPELFEEAARMRREVPTRSAEAIAAQLYAIHRIPVSARTIRSQLASRGLTRAALTAEPAVFGRFEAERVNQRWIGDYLVGPWVPHPKVARSRRARLMLYVDDKSRLLVHGMWGFTETTRSAQLTFKAAILRRGLPEALHLDRGAAFVAAPLRRSAAVLGVRIIHSRPYHPQGRGKQERLNRLIRERFIAEAEAVGIADLNELNERFMAWAESVCNTRVHTETRETPIARFLAGDPLRFPSAETLADAFLWSVIRKVSSTACVSLEGNRYQVDPVLVGKRVECRFVPEDLTTVLVYLEGRPAGAATPLVISAHTHPQVPKPPPAPTPPAVDYLGQVLADSEDAMPGAIAYRELPGAEAADHEAADPGEDEGRP